jgi:threonylcarbamoyladenosine tRNA methylthiotransferase MtaB
LHVFPFSPREGTAAAKMGSQISASVKNTRKKRLLALGERLESKYKERFNSQELEVLIEEKIGENRYRGLSENYLDIGVMSKNDVINKILTIRINENDCFLL